MHPKTVTFPPLVTHKVKPNSMQSADLLASHYYHQVTDTITNITTTTVQMLDVFFDLLEYVINIDVVNSRLPRKGMIG